MPRPEEGQELAMERSWPFGVEEKSVRILEA